MAAEWIAPAVASAVEGTTGIFGALAGMRNTDQVNAINQMNANLSYQHQLDREKVEDERYADETAYNRAWAEDERFYQRMFAENERSYQRAFAENERDYQRAFSEDERAYQRAWAQQQQDYNRALQQQIFEREDTSISRQANELSKLGINPLSSNMNGLGAGSLVSSSPSGSSSYSGSSSPSSSSGNSPSPSSSGRGNSAPAQLHYEQQLYDFSHIVNAISSVAQGVDGAITGQYQRDSLALQNDAQFLANIEKAHDLGIYYYPSSRNKKNPRHGHFLESGINGDLPFDQSFGWKSYGNWRQKNSNIHGINGHFYDSDDEKTKFIKNLANGDFLGIADNLINTLKKIGPKAKEFKTDFMDLFNPFKNKR